MSERSGLRTLLKFTAVYNAFQRAVGAERARRIFARDYAKAGPGQRVLDIGCGTAEILPYLGPVVYEGFDPNLRYIEDARRLYPTQTFFCSRVSGQTLRDRDAYDLIIAMFVLHHLEDVEATDLFRLAASKLKPGGRLVTIDPCYAPGQSRFARWMLGNDRGRFIRDEHTYHALAARVFPQPRADVRHDLLRIPYSHCILTCAG